ncbi:phage terminase large subunit [Sphingosinicella rhizophila]|uniref:Phage terminase large subunit n=1 Tax=Sphingosinicella rhizophila TaxID=3050082 RepID=A0ABU3Q3D8_9SPHN|nr:phage terminase large subunit [Sphingosinicella sp. GR2756]MDT9597924.1 phage terminase large subunit [Sphingosinicella sp. GR2756]
MTIMISDRRELEAILRNDLAAFTEKVFYHLNPGRAFTPGQYLQAMAYHARIVALERQVDRLVINLPPRSLKSTMMSVALPAFLLGRDPRLRIVVASYSQELSNFFARQTRSVLEADWYKTLFPSTRLNPRRTVEHDFQTTKNGGRFATSTGGTLTGRGGDIIIIDDPLKADDAYSDVRRQAMLEWTRTTLFSRLDDKRSGVIINVQQRLHEEDLSGHLLKSNEWLHLNLPAIAEENQRVVIGPNRFWWRQAGEPLHPLREPVEVLHSLKRDIGTAIFSAQYQQAPTPADGDVLKLSWFKRYDEAPVDGQVIMSLDTASKPGEHNDFSVCTTWQVANGRYYLRHVWRSKVDYPTLKRNVIALADSFRPDVLLIEDKVSGTGLIQDLREEAQALPVIPYLPQGDKETRMRLRAAAIEAQLVYLPRDAFWLDAFEMEVRQFPGGKHDDQIDSMSQMLDYSLTRQSGQLFIGSYSTYRRR